MIAKRIGVPARLSILIVGSVLAVGIVGGAVAQEPTPTPVTNVPHPAHIHNGSCANLDPNPAAPLEDVGPRMKDDELPSADDIKGSLTAVQIEVSETDDADINFDDLFPEAHAINVHESAQNAQNYIACGDIGGAVIDDKVIIGLVELNKSGYSGVAVVEKNGDNTKVTIYLGKGLGGTVAAPAATPTS
jgi:hypothetical protein